MNKRGKNIIFGDKIFARVTRNGQTIFNYVTEKVADMSQLLSELRFAMKDIHGLVMVHIRNYHQGWGEERPLMLYAQRVEKCGDLHPFGGDINTETSARKMFFPWETH